MDATESIVINEIAWMGSPVEGVEERQWWRYEWLELYNAGEEAVLLQGWKIELYDQEGLDFTIGLYKTVEAGGYFLVGASNKIPGVDVTYGSLSGKLVNSGQRIILKDAGGAVVEEINAKSGWFAGDNDSKLTMERRFPERGANSKENWGSSLTTGGTPKAQNTLFEKEAFLRLEHNPSTGLGQEESPGRPPFLYVVSSGVFILAFLLAVAFALAILLLWRYLARAPR